MKQMVTNLLNIELLKSDCILASDIYQYDSEALLYKKGTILTKAKIDKLKKFGLLSIPIYTYEDKKIEYNDSDIVKRKIELEFDKIYEYASYIVSSVLNKKDIKNTISKMDSGIYDHSYKVALLATMIGINIEKFDQFKLEELAISSLLHDIGKSTIDFSVLNKPGKLTNEEYEIIKKHSQNGFDILTATEMFSPDICEAVLSHHENEDGSGYPNCQKGSEIPLYSRIIHICDVYSALTTKRCYKDAWSSEQAITMLDKDKEKFEPNLIEIFKTSLPIYMKDDIVFLSTNELATVIETNNSGILVKVFGNKRIENINSESNNRVYVKKKLNLDKSI